jgi:hypothetical protein
VSDWTIVGVRMLTQHATGIERPALVMRDPVRDVESLVVVVDSIRVDELALLAGFQYGDE